MDQYDKSNLAKKSIVSLGIEGSANKVGVGIVLYINTEQSVNHPSCFSTYEILANPRKTYIAPSGQGFLPRETAWHHQSHIVALVKIAIETAIKTGRISSTTDIDCICYTKGPGMGGPLRYS